MKNKTLHGEGVVCSILKQIFLKIKEKTKHRF